MTKKKICANKLEAVLESVISKTAFFYF
jgi:hypothetical protein